MENKLEELLEHIRLYKESCVPFVDRLNYQYRDIIKYEPRELGK